MSDPRQRAATPDLLQALRRSGALPVEAHREAAWWIARPLPPATWRQILDPLALVLGITLIVSGVLYVVAFNWSELGRFSKVLVGVAPVLVCGLATLVAGTKGLTGRVLATAGIPLTLGALLAVGLAFPTNGDAWPLFALWAGLSAFWALASRMDIAWIGVVIAVDVTLGSMLSSIAPDDAPFLYDLVIGGFAGVHALSWAALGAAALAGLRGTRVWVRQVLLAPALILITWWPMEVVTLHLWDDTELFSVIDPIGTVLYVVIGLVVHAGFLLKRWGPFPVAIQLLTLIVLTTTACVRVLVEFIDQVEVLAIFATLPIGLFVIVQLAASAGWLLWGLAPPAPQGRRRARR